MVKGVSRQVIVVRQPDTKLFEQAIFLLREEALGAEGVTDQQVLKEACRVADQYVRTRVQGAKKPRRHRLQGLSWMLLGSGVTGLAWLLSFLL